MPAKDHNVSGSFTATGQSAALVPTLSREYGWGQFHVIVYGTFEATVQLEVKYDDTDWTPCAGPDLAPAEFTEPVAFIAQGVTQGAQFRLNCTAFTSGEVEYRMVQ